MFLNTPPNSVALPVAAGKKILMRFESGIVFAAELRVPTAASSGELVVSGVTVQTDSSTVFRGPNGNQITPEKFFDSLVEGVTDLEVSGTTAGSLVQADSIEIDD